jgi:hypothetical protein
VAFDRREIGGCQLPGDETQNGVFVQAVHDDLNPPA